MRLFYASDLHGSETCFRKFVRAASFYQADVLILGGDVSGKGVVPVITGSDGTNECCFAGSRHRVRGDAGIRKLRAMIARSGFYAAIMTAGEREGIDASAERKESLFRECVTSSLRQWIELAETRLPETTQFYWMPGNDDPPYLVELMASSARLTMCEERVVSLSGRVQMVSLGYSNITPFNSARELEEADLAARIAQLTRGLGDPHSSIFNFHCPPRDSGLDAAPELTSELRVVVRGVEPIMVAAGSQAVRDAIEKVQPALGLHGHIHDSRGVAKIGQTTCLNPGSNCASGVLQGAIVDLDESRGHVASYQFVSG